MRADVLRLGKFDVEEHVRLRAFHLARRGRRATSLRIQAQADLRAPGVRRAVRARRQVREHAPELAPRLLGHGRLEAHDLDYLQEELVDGRPPRDRGETELVLGRVLAGLARLQRAVGVERRPLSEVTHPDLPQRWERVAAELDLLPSLTAKVAGLLDRDGLVDVSLVHGDLVASNLLLTGAAQAPTPVLVDWEHARPRRPIAADLAKLHQSVRTPEVVVERCEQLLGRGVAGSYTVAEQFALAHAEMLSWHEHRAGRADAAGRRARYDADTGRRVGLLAELLGVDLPRAG